jgi:hypothetical protein
MLELMDNIPSTIYTDSSFILTYIASDNIAITDWEVLIDEYPDWDVNVMRTENGFNIEVQTNERIDEIDVDIEMTISDGNLTSEMVVHVVKLKDATPPVISIDDLIVTMGMSETYDLHFNATDNSGYLEGASLLYSATDTSTYQFEIEGADGDYNLEIVPPAPGGWILNITITDGINSAWKHIHLTITDDQEPEIEINIPDLEISKGEDTTLSVISASDDSNIVSYVWTIEGPDGTKTLEGSEIKFSKEESGDYNITLTVTDEFGNSAVKSTTITVTPDSDEEQKDDLGWLIYLLIIGSVILLIIVVVAVFLAMRRREPEYVIGGQEGDDEGEEDEEEMEWT